MYTECKKYTHKYNSKCFNRIVDFLKVYERCDIFIGQINSDHDHIPINNRNDQF